MRIFEGDGKYNFVDENNVFVGYDSGQDCCESATWAILGERPSLSPDNTPSHGDNAISGRELEFRFDTSFHENVSKCFSDLDAGDAVMFRLVSATSEAFLVLSNCHNGYYGHGFKMTKDGKTLFDGCL